MKFESKASICNFWMKFINEDLMNNISKPLQFTPSSLFSKIEDLFLQTTGSQTEADTYCSAPSPHTADSMFSNRRPISEPCKHCWESEAHWKRERFDYGILKVTIQGLPRSDLLDCLKTHWQALMRKEIYMTPSRQVLMWTLKNSLKQACWLQNHLILQHLNCEDNLHQ